MAYEYSKIAIFGKVMPVFFYRYTVRLSDLGLRHLFPRGKSYVADGEKQTGISPIKDRREWSWCG